MAQDQARDLALDPATPAARLAEIATHRPDLRVFVAAHPQAYPELLAWLRGLGDPAVVAAVDARSAAVPPPAPGFPAHPGELSPGAQPVPAAPGSEAAAGGQAAFVPEHSAFTAGTGPFTPGAEPFGAGAVSYADEIPTVPRRRRKGLVIAGAAAGVAVVLGGGAFAVNHFVLDKVNGSETPRAAFEQLVTGLEKKDALAMLGAMSPAEVSSFSGMLDASLTSAEGSSSATSIKAFTDALDALTITTSGVTTTETTLQEGLTKVEVSAGQITLDGDVEKLGDAFLALWQEILAQNPELTDLIDTYGGGQSSDPQALRAELVTMLDEALPATESFTDLAREGNPFFVVTVEEKGSWYVSPYLSVGEAAYLSSGTTAPRGTMLGDGKGTGFASPVAAADGLLAAVVSGNLDSVIAALPLPERRALSVYMPTVEASALPVEVAGTFTSTDSGKGRALLVPKNLTVTSADPAGSVTLDGTCLTIVDRTSEVEGRICTDEAPLLNELGLSKLGFVAVEESGTWFVSPTETLVEAARVTSEATTALQKAGKLDDPKWLEERSTALLEYLAAQPLFAGLASQLDPSMLMGGLPGTGLEGLDGLEGLEGLDGLEGLEGLEGFEDGSGTGGADFSG